MSIATLAASGGGASAAGGGGSATTVVAAGEGNNADAPIGEEHNDRTRNTTTLQMIKTRDLIVCLSFFVPITAIAEGVHQLQRDVGSPWETSSLLLI